MVNEALRQPAMNLADHNVEDVILVCAVERVAERIEGQRA